LTRLRSDFIIAELSCYIVFDDADTKDADFEFVASHRICTRGEVQGKIIIMAIGLMMAIIIAIIFNVDMAR